MGFCIHLKKNKNILAYKFLNVSVADGVDMYYEMHTIGVRFG